MTEARIRRCPECGRYTLRAECPACRNATRTPHPVRFSPQDRYAKYRRALLSAASSPRSPP